MKKRDYERPTMKVVQLHHRTHLLVNSVTATSVSATMNGTFMEEDLDE